MNGLIESAKKWARKHYDVHGNCNSAIQGSKNWAREYYRKLTGKDIPKEILDELEDQLRKELDCL
ncbi:hypothetical protein [Archaeoglobus sp.]